MRPSARSESGFETADVAASEVSKIEDNFCKLLLGARPNLKITPAGELCAIVPFPFFESTSLVAVGSSGLT